MIALPGNGRYDCAPQKTKWPQIQLPLFVAEESCSSHGVKIVEIRPRLQSLFGKGRMLIPRPLDLTMVADFAEALVRF